QIQAKSQASRRKTKVLSRNASSWNRHLDLQTGQSSFIQRMTMTGLLLNLTKTDFSPEGLSPHESAMHTRARTHAQPRERIHEGLVDDSPLVLAARLKRLLNGWI